MVTRFDRLAARAEALRCELLRGRERYRWYRLWLDREGDWTRCENLDCVEDELDAQEKD